VESFERFLGVLRRLFGPPRLFLLLVCWILSLGMWGMVAREYLPMEHRIRWEIPLELQAPLYAKFDSGWYLSIMQWGYGPPPPQGRPSAHAFFPLYPTAAKVLHKTFAIHGFHAGLIITYLCLFLAMRLFFEEGRRRLGETEAWHAVFFLLLFPASFFLAAVYAEAMFLLFALLAFRDARAGRTGLAALWGILLGLTRASALAVAPALFLAALERRSLLPARRWARALLIGAIPIATVFVWIFGIGHFKGEPGLFFRAMGGWHRGAGSLAGVAEWFWQMKLSIKFGHWMKEPGRAFDYGVVILIATVGLYQLFKKRWSDAAWTGAAVALPITTGVTGGIPRFLMVVYPIYFALAEGSRGAPRARWIVWIVSGALLLLASAKFVNWHWVA